MSKKKIIIVLAALAIVLFFAYFAMTHVRNNRNMVDVEKSEETISSNETDEILEGEEYGFVGEEIDVAETESENESASASESIITNYEETAEEEREEPTGGISSGTTGGDMLETPEKSSDEEY